MPWRSRPLPYSHILLTLAGILIWSLALWHGLEVFGPGRDINNVSFNSDSAINVMMANDDRPITIFNFYYYGADRWGGWAFLLAQLIRRATGYFWTPESLTALQIVWVFLGAPALAGLAPRDRWLTGLLYLAVVCVHRESRYLLFELSQVYAWQNTATLLGWYGLRRVFDSYREAPAGHANSRPWAWLLFAFGATYLAVWSSVASAAFLVLLLGLEVLRARVTHAAGWLDRRMLVPGTLGLCVVAGAVLLERWQKVLYREYSVRTYGNPFITIFSIDWDYLTRNFGEHWHNLVKLSWWPLYPVPALTFLVFIALLLYAVVARKPDLRARVLAALASDTAIAAMGTYLMAAANFALTGLVDHVRHNDYDTRYLTLTNVFAPISAVLSILVLVRFVIRQARPQAYVQPVFVAAVLTLMVVAFPTSRETSDYKQLKRTAAALAEKAPHGILMGKYWDTYVFTSLQSRDAMTPVPIEPDAFRTPWTPAALQRAREVVFAYPVLGRQPPVPASTRQHYGRTLTLVDPRWYEDQAYTFALYAVSR